VLFVDPLTGVDHFYQRGAVDLPGSDLD
jgi:hypothetical protein